MMKEEKKEQTKEEADEVNPTGNRLHLEAAPALTYAHPDDKAVAGDQPGKQDRRVRAEDTQGANTIKENQETDKAETTTEQGKERYKLSLIHI